MRRVFLRFRILLRLFILLGILLLFVIFFYYSSHSYPTVSHQEWGLLSDTNSKIKRDLMEYESKKLSSQPIKQDPIYSNSLPILPQHIDLLQHHRFIPIRGWSFCPTLEGATFDAFAHIYPLNGSLIEKNPTMDQVVFVVESQAKEIFIRMDQTLSDKELDYLDLRRFACHFAADGANGVASITDVRFLKHIEPQAYFPFLSLQPDIWKEKTLELNVDEQILGLETAIETLRKKKAAFYNSKQHYKMAYQILAHDLLSFENLKLLFTKLDTVDSIIMIHVDIKAPKLKAAILEFILRRLEQGYRDNIYLQKTCFGIIWGHISIVHAQLEGFFELMDLAHWDYVVNLSAYDWPLKSTTDMYDYLKKNGSANWIEYWKDPEGSVTRLSRPHVALAQYKGMFHSWDTGLRWWPFPTYQAYKHHQWMILHRSFIHHLRTDVSALDLLAFMEYTWIPDESYFGIVAVNHPNIKVISQSKRYLKFEGGWHPIVLNYTNRYDMLVSDHIEDSYFFMRKVEAANQTAFLRFLDEKSFYMTPLSPCQPDDIGFRPHCFIQILKKMASESPDNSIILIPVNTALFDVAMNLYCSLNRLKMHTSVLFWSIDAVSHTKLVSKNILSYYNNEKFFGISTLQQWHRGSFSKLVRQKVGIWRELIENDISFWNLDADTVVLHDFRTGVLKDDVDIHLSLDESVEITQISQTKPVPNTCTGMMHMRSSEETMLFLDLVDQKLKEFSWMEDQEAVNYVLKSELISTHSRIFVKNHRIAKKWADLITHVERQHNHKQKPKVDQRITVKLFEQKEFLSGHYLYSKSHDELRRLFPTFYVIHVNGKDDKQDALKRTGLWLLKSPECRVVQELAYNIE